MNFKNQDEQSIPSETPTSPKPENTEPENPENTPENIPEGGEVPVGEPVDKDIE